MLNILVSQVSQFPCQQKMKRHRTGTRWFKRKRRDAKKRKKQKEKGKKQKRRSVRDC
jgi:hypothetical protein